MHKLLPGQLFQERYRIEEELGAGGMGIVYRAVQIDACRQVAVKILRPERFGQESEYRRFLREFRLLSRTSHPNIVLFYSHGLSEQRVPYAICEYLEGRSLQAVLNDEIRLDWPRVAKIALQIAMGLEHAHSFGIIHRDLKPANIIICDKPEPDWIKIIDFGLARMEDQSEIEKLTLTGTLLGTAHYMSPEQCRGQRLDKRSDMYSFGCLLFEALAGEKLIEQDNPITVLHLHCTADFSERLALLKEVAPPEMVALMTRLLAKSPADRPESMKEVIGVLEELIQDTSTTQKLRGSLVQPQKQKRKFLIFGISTLCVLSSAWYLFAKFYYAPGNSEPPDLASAPDKRVHVRRDFAALIKDLGRLYPGNKQKLARKKVIESWLKKYGSDLRISSSEMAAVYLELLAVENDEEMKDTIDKCGALAKTLDPNQPSTRNFQIGVAVNAAELYLRKGERGKALKIIQQAQSTYQNVELQQSDEVAHFYVLALASFGEFASALELQKKIIAQQNDNYEQFLSAGNLCVLLDRRQEAINYYKLAHLAVEAEAKLREKNQLVTGLSKNRFTSRLNTGSRLDLAVPNSLRLSRLANFLRWLGEKETAQKWSRDSLSLAILESEKGIRVRYKDWCQMEALATALGLDERQTCIQNEMAALEREISESKDAQTQFDLRIQLSTLLFSAGRKEESIKSFETANEKYSVSKEFNKLVQLRENMEYAANTSLEGGKPAAGLARKFLESLRKYPEEKVPGELDAVAGLVLALEKNPAAEKFFENATNKCMFPNASATDRQLTWAYLLEGSRFEQCRRVLLADSPEGEAVPLLLISLAEKELSAGDRKQAAKDFKYAYQLILSKAKKLTLLSDDLVLCQLGILASS